MPINVFSFQLLWWFSLVHWQIISHRFVHRFLVVLISMHLNWKWWCLEVLWLYSNNMFVIVRWNFNIDEMQGNHDEFDRWLRKNIVQIEDIIVRKLMTIEIVDHISNQQLTENTHAAHSTHTHHTTFVEQSHRHMCWHYFISNLSDPT